MNFGLRYAEKYCTRRMDTSSKSHWLEMGLLTLSVIAYRRTDGKLSVEMYVEIVLFFHSSADPSIKT